LLSWAQRRTGRELEPGSVVADPTRPCDAPTCPPYCSWGYSPRPSSAVVARRGRRAGHRRGSRPTKSWRTGAVRTPAPRGSGSTHHTGHVHEPRLL